ncbi:MAG: hypothetical protein H6Q28_568 [Bacteroidetes bacterium]|nr:hypothetical protein [Bacteroidota bacterium]
MVLSVLAGAVLGYAYYYFIGCQTGACPITSNPLVSTAYGGLVGGLLSGSFRKGPAS